MASINPQRPPSGVGTFLLGLVCLGAFATGITVWVKATAPSHDLADVERASNRLKKREELEKTWAEKLTKPAWIEKDKGVVQLPIADAIRVTAVDLKSKPVAKTAAKVPALIPLAPPDPKSTEPAPPALPSAPQGADVIHFAAPAAAPTSAQATEQNDASAATIAENITPRIPLINWTESK